MIKFICKECNYRFSMNSDKRGKKCPYCGKETVEREPAAEELVEGA